MNWELFVIFEGSRPCKSTRVAGWAKSEEKKPSQFDGFLVPKITPMKI